MAHVTFVVTTLDGSRSYEVLEVNVKDNSIATTGMAAADTTTSSITGTGDAYTWERTDATKQPNPSATLKFKSTLDNSKVAVTAESKNSNVVEVTDWSKSTDKEITVNLRYRGKPGDSTEIVVTIGEGDNAVRKTVTITLAGTNESGQQIALPNPGFRR